MEQSSTVTHLLQETIHAVNTIIPLPHQIGEQATVDAPIIQPEIGVLIGITGHFRGRLLLESTSEVFSLIGNGMFGMPLEGEMLESFAGELGNMMGGHISTGASARNIFIDITPPTVIVGQTKLSGFSTAHCIPVHVQDVGDMRIILIPEKNKKKEF